MIGAMSLPNASMGVMTIESLNSRPLRAADQSQANLDLEHEVLISHLQSLISLVDGNRAVRIPSSCSRTIDASKPRA